MKAITTAEMIVALYDWKRALIESHSLYPTFRIKDIAEPAVRREIAVVDEISRLVKRSAKARP